MSAENSHDMLDQAVRAHAEDQVVDGELITSWLVVAATRSYHGGGVVVTLSSDDGLPTWEARGMLATALRAVDRQEDNDQ